MATNLDPENPVGRGRALSSSEVAALFRVDDKTPPRWAAAGRIYAFRVPSGRLRFWESDVLALLERGEHSPPKSGAPVEDFISWLLWLDEPEGAEDRRDVTLQTIIDNARVAWQKSRE